MKEFYRYSTFKCALVNGVGVRLNLDVYRLEWETPKGCWIVKQGPERHFILHRAKKKFAYPSKEQAWESFVIRQEHRHQHAANALHTALAALEIAHAGLEKAEHHMERPIYINVLPNAKVNPSPDEKI